ncbi:hypothetical protein JGY68_000084 [Salmonella enterica]|nr:hypothetical protein [Salmonella enterica subsp. salamae]ECL1288124.1 hypothetical protein [Salmonella enterica]ECJ2729154.1 hypothetical protein [Salmonella enterica subsp. salamae]EEA0957374.1 hypothetical protein [Salmonella enterica]EGH5308838.1 hypothetical protein [Salmonella enterica]
MPSKNRITVNFSSEHLCNFIKDTAKKNNISPSKLAENLLINAIQNELKDPKLFLENQSFGRNRNLLPQNFYRKGLAASVVEVDDGIHGTILAKNHIIPYMKRIYPDCLSDGGEQKLTHDMVNEKSVKKFINEIINKTPGDGINAFSHCPDMAIKIVTEAKVSYEFKKDPYTNGKHIEVIINIEYRTIPLFYNNKENPKFYCFDYENIRYMTFKEVATQGWNRSKYSHLLHIPDFYKNNRNKKTDGGYFIGLLYEEKTFEPSDKNGFTYAKINNKYVAVKTFDNHVHILIKRPRISHSKETTIDDSYFDN